MFKKTMTYEDFNGESRTEDFYFHLSKAELIKLEMSTKGGLSELTEKIIKEQDNEKLIEIFEKLILMSYGEKSADGREFIKNDAVREKFSSTQAYSDLFMELLDAKVMVSFFNGIFPKDLVAEVEKETKAAIAKLDAEKETLPETPKAPDKPITEMTREELLVKLNEATK